MNDLIGKDGINFNVKLDNQDLLFAGIVIFSSLLLAGVALIFINKAVR